jgi:hypothetical protein
MKLIKTRQLNRFKCTAFFFRENLSQAVSKFFHNNMVIPMLCSNFNIFRKYYIFHLTLLNRNLVVPELSIYYI